MKTRHLIVPIVLLVAALVFIGATSHESGTKVRKVQMQYHNAAATNGVSNFAVDNSYVNTALVQAVGGDVRWGYYNTFLSGNTVTASYGFVLEENDYLELISRDQVVNFRWMPHLNAAATGATVYSVQEG